MTQDVSTPDEHNPAEVPQAPKQAAQTPAEIDPEFDAHHEAASAPPAPPPVSNEFVAPGAEPFSEDEPLNRLGDKDSTPETLVDEGLALLKSGAQAVESEVRKVVTFVEHGIVPAGVGPRTVEAARNLPFAAPGETLFEAGEHLLFRAFRDVGDEVRHIYLNEFGNHVKA